MRKGGVLIEVIIGVSLIAFITAAMLRLYNIERGILRESKESLIAMNALDSIMTYFEDYYNETTNPTQWEDTSGAFMPFADGGSLANINLIREGTILTEILGQLNEWQIDYRIDAHSGSDDIYRDRMVILRITWQGQRRDAATGNPIQRNEELFSIFTSAQW